MNDAAALTTLAAAGGGVAAAALLAVCAAWGVAQARNVEVALDHLARAAELAPRGQRAATFLIYLNEAYEGGATQFPRLDWQYRGGRGDALLFSNVDAAGAPDYNTVHAGMPATSGEKWVLSQWIRTRPVGP